MTLRPDNRTRLKDDGHDSPHVEHVFYDLQIWGFDALGRPGQYMLSVHARYVGERHCLSLDFRPRRLAALLPALPTQVRQSIESQLHDDPDKPKRFRFPHPIYFEFVAATLGKLQQGPHERFVPLNARKIKLTSAV